MYSELHVYKQHRVKMTGKVIIVTGASSGLGYETARYLCEGGNDVILACRDEEKTKRVIAKIKQQNPNALATYMHVSSLLLCTKI